MHEKTTAGRHLVAISAASTGMHAADLGAFASVAAVELPPRGGAPAVRRVARVAVALGKLTLTRSPRWARVAAVACLAIPGPLDELIVWPALLAYVAIRYRHEFTAVARAAWSA